MNRTFVEDQLTPVKRLCRIFTVVSVGVAGAVTLKKRQFNAMGAVGASASTSLVNAPTSGAPYAFGDGPAGAVRSVVRTGAGAWTVTLCDSYQYLLGVACIQVSNANGLIASGFSVGIVSGSTNVATNTATGNGGVIALVLNNGSGAATDPANGDTLTLEITLGDSTAP